MIAAEAIGSDWLHISQRYTPIPHTNLSSKVVKNVSICVGVLMWNDFTWLHLSDRLMLYPQKQFITSPYWWLMQWSYHSLPLKKSKYAFTCLCSFISANKIDMHYLHWVTQNVLCRIPTKNQEIDGKWSQLPNYRVPLKVSSILQH